MLSTRSRGGGMPCPRAGLFSWVPGLLGTGPTASVEQSVAHSALGTELCLQAGGAEGLAAVTPEEMPDEQLLKA